MCQKNLESNVALLLNGVESCSGKFKSATLSLIDIFIKRVEVNTSNQQGAAYMKYLC